MADKIVIDNPHRVAYDLMLQIAEAEKDQVKDRRYFLELYEQCREIVVRGFSVDKILKTD